MTDKEKLAEWNRVCIENGWAREYELDSWLLNSGARYTRAGSLIPEQFYEIDNPNTAELVVNGADTGEGLATLIIEAIVGMIQFRDFETEKTFWNIAEHRLEKQFDVKLPKKILSPYYIS